MIQNLQACVGALRTTDANAAASAARPAGLPLPSLPEPSSGAASRSDVERALQVSSARIGAMIASGGGPSSALMMLLTEVTRANESMQMERIEQQHSEKQAANQAEKRAIQEAIEQQSDASFWGDVTRVLSYVGAGVSLLGSIAALPFSGGTSLVAGLCAAAALVGSGGALVLQGATDLGLCKPSSELSIVLACVGLLGAGGGAISAAVSGSSQALGATARGLATATKVAQSLTQAGQTVTGYVAGRHQAASIDRRADAEQARTLSADAQFKINDALDGLRNNETVRQRAVRYASGVENARHMSAMLNLRA